MVILNCLWVGALAGLVGSRLVRTSAGYAPTASCIAVGILGGLVGLLLTSRFGYVRGELPHVDIVAAGIGATVTLMAWGVTQRLCTSRH